MGSLISGKSRLMKYYNLARWLPLLWDHEKYVLNTLVIPFQQAGLYGSCILLFKAYDSWDMSSPNFCMELFFLGNGVPTQKKHAANKKRTRNRFFRLSLHVKTHKGTLETPGLKGRNCITRRRSISKVADRQKARPRNSCSGGNNSPCWKIHGNSLQEHRFRKCMNNKRPYVFLLTCVVRKLDFFEFFATE